MRAGTFALAVLAATIVMFAAATVMADDEIERPGYGMGPGMMAMGFGPGYDASSEDFLKFLDSSSKLRKELHMKMFEYNEALRDPKTKDSELGKFVREIRELREKIEDMYKQMLMPEKDEIKK